jgi:hypothetical protein
MFRKDESHQRDRRSGRHQKDPQRLGPMGSETATPTPTAKIRSLFSKPHIEYSARPGATYLPIAPAPIDYFKRDFLLEYIVLVLGLGQELGK